MGGENMNFKEDAFVLLSELVSQPRCRSALQGSAASFLLPPAAGQSEVPR